MCVSCGCGNGQDDHGDSRNITMQRLQDAASAANTSVDQVVQNLQQSARQGGRSSQMGSQARQ